MANAFMPSALSSLNAAGQDSLESIMKQRLFEQQMQQQMLQGQGQLNNFRLDLRQQDAQERYRDDMMRRYDNDRAAGLEEVRLKLGAEANEAQGKALALQQFIEARQRGDREGMLRYGQAAGLPMASLLKEPEAPRDLVKESRDRRRGVIEADAQGRKEGLLPTKVAKGPRDSAKLPEGVKAAIRAKKGQPGWTSGLEALQTLDAKGHWDQLLGDHPDLDRNAVRAFIGNLYNQRLTPTMVAGGKTGATSTKRTLNTDDDLKKMQERALAAVDSFQKY